MVPETIPSPPFPFPPLSLDSTSPVSLAWPWLLLPSWSFCCTSSPSPVHPSNCCQSDLSTKIWPADFSAYLNTFLLLIEFNVHFYIWHIGVPCSPPGLLPTSHFLHNDLTTQKPSLICLHYLSTFCRLSHEFQFILQKNQRYGPPMNSSLAALLKATIIPLHCHCS